MQTLIDNITKQISDLSTDQLIELNNLYCQECNLKGEIYTNDEEFFEMFFSGAGGAEKAVRAAFYGEYRYMDNYVKFNGYGNLESFDYFEVDDLVDFPSTMAEYIAENLGEFEHLFDLEDLETA